ncbi:unnamed protein product [Symbiodinium sp. CCMP2592]|nr:unnamed protein product [Symbiodinium sp. CCMP2592]
MGRKWHRGQQWDRDTDYVSTDYGGSYHLWGGAYSASPKAAPKAKSRLRYDQTVVPDRPAKPALPSEEDSLAIVAGGNGPLSQAIQKALTMAKKSDGRVRKLRKDIATRRAQFDQFGRELKASYAAEQRRFDADVQRLEEEVQAAAQSGQQAARAVQHLVLHGVQEQKDEDEEAAADAAWNQLMAAPAPEEEPPSQFLADAMAAVRSVHVLDTPQPRRVPAKQESRDGGDGLSRPPPGLTAPASAPSANPRQEIPGTGSGLIATGAVDAHSAPNYATEPVGAPFAHSPGCPAGPAVAPVAVTPEGRRPAGKPRTPIKAHTKPTHPPSGGRSLGQTMQRCLARLFAVHFDFLLWVLPALPPVFRGGPLSFGLLQRCCKLDQEPPSHTPQQRADLERLRAVELHDLRPWPRLPASDGPAPPTTDPVTAMLAGVEPSVPFTFGILIPGYATETVQLSLFPPVEVHDALELLQQERDQVQARLFPVLLPVRPMPSPNYGIVAALPSWTTSDVCLCLDLQEVDGRLYTDLGPTAASHEVLLRLVGLPENAPVDVYLGASAVPIQATETVELDNGCTLFFTPQFALPGAYFFLEDILLSSHGWHEDAFIPQGPDDPVLCVVTDRGPQLVSFPDEASFGEAGTIARMLELPEEQLVLQPAVPPVRDAAMKGRRCRGVFGASGWVPRDEARSALELVPPVLGLVDCRALLQGWDLISSPQGRFPFADFYDVLATFTPPHWELYLERAIQQEHMLQYFPGAVIYASYMPLRTVDPATSSGEDVAHDMHVSDRDDNSSAHDESQPEPGVTARARSESASDTDADMSDAGLASRHSPREEEVSPGPSSDSDDSPGSADSDSATSSGETSEFSAVFVVLTPEYIPEIITIVVPGPCSWRSVQRRVQAARPPLRRGRFPALRPVEPQPVQDHVLLLAVPAWSDGVFVAIDCSRVNGPISDSERVDLCTGYCVSFLPPRNAVLVVSDVCDRLRNPTGWNLDLRLPVAPGFWIHVLTDTGPVRLLVPRERRRFLRQHVADSIQVDVDRLFLQAARPPLRDSCDQGILADNVFVATANHTDVLSGDPPVAYFLDARPMLAGVTWSFAPAGIPDEAMILDFCSPYCPPGYRAVISGGQRDASGVLRVGAGEVLCVDCALTPQGVDEARPHPDRPSDSSPGPDQPDDPDSSSSDDDPSHGRSVRRRTHNFAPASGFDPAPNGGPVGTRMEKACNAEVLDHSLLRVGLHPRAQTMAAGLFLLRAVLMSLTPVLSRIFPILILLESINSSGKHLSGPLFLKKRASAARDPSDIPFGKPPPSLRHVSLVDELPVTPHQQLALQLLDIMPQPGNRCTLDDLCDWLDNDLRSLLSDPRVPVEKRALFQRIPLWHRRGSSTGPPCTGLRVYTDGSADSGAPDCIAPGAWAFSVWVVADREYLFGHAAGLAARPGDTAFLGEPDDSALSCEQLAIAWALVWVIQFGESLGFSVELRYDCQAAGKGAFGASLPPKVGAQRTPSELSDFVCYLRQTAANRIAVSHSHVPAHSGHTANELCDELAKQARRNSASCTGDLLPTWPGLLFLHPYKAWSWLPPSGTSDLPTLYSFEAEARRMQCLNLVGQMSPSLGRQASPARTGTVQVKAKFVTANVLTLLDPRSRAQAPSAQSHAGMRVIAKKEVLKRQFLQAGVLLAGLQETRLQQSSIMPDAHFVMLHAGASDNGHFGVALWANTTVPYAEGNGRSWYFQRQHFTVSEATPRLLVVQISTPILQWTVVVAHGISDLTGASSAAASFWTHCLAVLERRPKFSDVIILTDANAHLGATPSESVGDHDGEDENPAGTGFHEFLARASLWLPSTFSVCHTGPSHTWLGPGGTLHRLDFVGVPLHWHCDSMRTHVWYDFEQLQTKDDHYPVVAVAEFACRPRASGPAAFHRLAVRPPLDAVPPESYFCNLAVAAASPQATWQAPVDVHYAHVAQAWTTAGRALCPHQVRQPCQTYLSVDTLQLVTWRKAWRNHLRTVRRQRNNRLLACGFLSWRCFSRGELYTDAQAWALLAWLRGLDVDIAQASRIVSDLGFRIKQATRDDRNRYLEGLVQAVTLSDLRDPKALFSRVRRAFPQSRSARRPVFQPLPAVQKANGELACSLDERHECWRSHFAEQEAGEVIPDASYPAALRAQKAVGHRSDTVFELACVPTLAGIERSVCGLPAGKAAGFDGITGELMRAHAPSSARLLVAVYTKSALGLYEPIEFRGGALLPLAKRAASSLTCDKFRSILVSSLPGKVLHQQLRRQLLHPLERAKTELQAGAMPGVSTEAIAMTARVFRDIVKRRGLPHALTFFDIKAAYYRVLRQVLTQVGDTERALRRLFSDLGIPSSALQELVDKLLGVGALGDADTPEHLQRMLADALQGTWFRVDQSAVLTLTHRGVRPGDCLADVLFAFTFSAYMTAAEHRLHSLGLSTATPQASGTALECFPDPPSVLGCASWADDFVQMTVAENRPSLVPRVIRIVGVFLEQAEVAGIQLTFACDKTATLLEDSGFGDPLVQTDDEGPYLEIRSSVTGTVARLPIVPAYRHLGGIITASGTPAPEINYRHSLAAGVIRPLRTRLFASPTIPLRTRLHLLKSLAISRFAFGSAAILMCAALHGRLWYKYYISIWRSIWKRGKGEPTMHSYEVLRRAGAPSPPLALALSRAVFIRQLVRSGPSTLLHLLRVQWCCAPESSWLGQLERDVEHVALFLPELRDLLPARRRLESLLEAITDAPNWWVSKVKQAGAVFQKDLERWRKAKDDAGEAPSVRPSAALLASSSEEPELFSCSWCPAKFTLRKHLGAHLAKSHGIFSPARHLAFGTSCISCLKCYHSVARVQAHLKSSDRCLRRSCLLAPPLSVPDIRNVEDEETKGFGPANLTADERLAACGEDLELSVLSRLYRPSPTFLAWIDAFIDGRSHEGHEFRHTPTISGVASQGHHSQPRYLEDRSTSSVSMGRKWHRGQQWDRDTDYVSTDYGGSYHLWGGAYSASPKAAPKAKSRLRYDQTVVPDRPAKPALPSEEDSLAIVAGGNGPLSQAIQKALTMAKKSDGRVRKLRKDIATRRAQFDQFGRELKASYAAEQRRFDADVQRLEEEVQAAAQSGQQAARAVQHLVLHGVQEQKDEDEEAAADAAWNQLMAAPAPEEEPPSQFLADAMEIPGTGSGLIATGAVDAHSAPNYATEPVGAPFAHSLAAPRDRQWRLWQSLRKDVDLLESLGHRSRPTPSLHIHRRAARSLGQKLEEKREAALHGQSATPGATEADVSSHGPQGATGLPAQVINDDDEVPRSLRLLWFVAWRMLTTLGQVPSRAAASDGCGSDVLFGRPWKPPDPSTPESDCADSCPDLVLALWVLVALPDSSIPVAWIWSSSALFWANWISGLRTLCPRLAQPSGCGFDAQVPNSRIGGSGPSTSYHGERSSGLNDGRPQIAQLHGLLLSALSSSLHSLASHILPICHSICAILQLGLLKLLGRALPRRFQALRRALRFLTLGVPGSVVLPLGYIGVGGFRKTQGPSRSARVGSVVPIPPVPCQHSGQASGPASGVSWWPTQFWLAAAVASSNDRVPDPLLATAPAALCIETVALGQQRHSPRCCKLDQEPPSHTPQQRADLERLRAVELHDLRPWPRLPASDGPAPPTTDPVTAMLAGVEPSVPFTFGILIPGYATETVQLSLFPPVEVHDALELLQQERDQVQARLFPVLLPVRPMPSPNYGIVAALPSWTTSDVCLCLDLQEVDGRLYTDLGPTAASREVLLRLVGLPENAPVDVYLGASAVPIQATETVELDNGCTLFFTPQFALPGAYFFLEDILLSSHGWHEDAFIPQGPDDPVLCVVTDRGPQLVSFPDEASFGEAGTIERMLELPEEQLVLQPAVPPVRDAAMKGRRCRGVFGASGWVPRDEARSALELVPPVLGLVDCRALLQGWDLISSPQGRFPFADFYDVLATFTPPHWELYLERAIQQEHMLQYFPGAVIYASYMPLRTVDPATSSGEDVAHDMHVSDRDDNSSAHDESQPEPGVTARARSESASDTDADMSDAGLASRHSPREEEVSPGPSSDSDDSPGSADSDSATSSGETSEFSAVFVVLTPEYIPEIITIVVPGPCSWRSVQRRVQAARPPLRRGRFPALRPVEPQPVQDHVLLLAVPAWSDGVFVAIDCSRVNGTFFSVAARAQVDRAYLLAAAGFPPSSDLEVYVHNLLGPISDSERVDLCTGYCVSFLPPRNAVLVVSDVCDRLRNPTGWNLDLRLPVAPGFWIHVLTDTGPVRLLVPRERRRFLRQHVADSIQVDVDRLFLQAARPPLRDSCDQGILADNVFVATANHTDVLSGDPPVAYFLDARPMLAGVTWSFAPAGIPDEAMILDFCSPYCPPGYRAVISGGQRDASGVLRVGAGEVLCVDCALTPQGVDEARPHPDRPSDSSPGPDQPDDPDSSSSDDDPSHGRSVRRRTHNFAPASGFDPAPNGGPVGTRMEKACNAEVLDHSLLRVGLHPRAQTMAAGLFLLRAVLMSLTPVLSRIFPILILLESINSSGKHLSGPLFLKKRASAARDPSDIPFGKPPPSLRHVSLVDELPVTPHQQLALQLLDIMPQPGNRCTLDDLCDWLDNDLRSLLSDPRVPVEKRALFQRIPLWHRRGSSTGPPCTGLRVYTDGSADSGAPDCIAPGAWAFSVWVVADREYLFGHAAGLAARPGDTAFLGEPDDSALSCEQLAIAWALVWVIQFGESLGFSVELRYDCQAAGHGAGCLPAVPAISLRYTALKLRQASPARTGTVQVKAKFVTANVLTLLDPRSRAQAPSAQSHAGMRVIAKKEVLKRQFLQAGVLLAGLQETRLQQSSIMPDAHFVMLHAGASDNGHFGVALWANTTVPYAEGNGRSWYFQRQHFTVSEATPRLLVVQISTPILQWTVVVAHGISDLTGASSAAASFWTHCLAVLERRPKFSDVIILTDANAHLGATPSESVGDHDGEDENPAGTGFHEFLARASLWLPSTFSVCHTGPSHTWLGPGGTLHRLDFVGVPLHWHCDSMRTHVWYDFEQLQTKDDHYPVVAVAEFACRPRASGPAAFHRLAVRPPLDAVPPESYFCNLAVAAASPQATWQAPVDVHYAHVAQAWTTAGRALCPHQVRQPCQTYLSVDTLQLVTWRKAWRNHLRTVRRQRNNRLLACGFLSWRCFSRGELYTDAQAWALLAWLRGLDVDIAQASRIVSDLGFRIKQATRDDRNRCLEGLVQAVTLSDLRDPKALFSRVRRAFPQSRSARRPVFQPLPAVQKANGELACSLDERHECWRSHFAEQEAGEVIPDASYPAALRAQKAVGHRSDTVFELACVPTLAGIERSVCGLPAGKAAGFDGITGELMRAHAPSSARLLVAVYTKSALGLYEPIEFRGGALLPLAKRAASSLTCDKFRSILVSSLPGKVLHQQLRRQLLHPLERAKTELQAGAMPGVSTEAIAMTARVFRDIVKRRGLPHALTFFDIKAAYYRVLRQVLTQVGDTERALRRLFSDLGIPSSALQELVDKLLGVGALGDADTPEHLQRMLADALQGTWFRVDQSAVLTLTHRGVRPGDCLADVLFAFTFSAYMTAAEHRLHSLGLSTATPQASGTALECFPDPPSVLGCASWADDFVQMTVAENRPSLVPRVIRIVGVFLEQAEVAGIQLTFACDKTATLLEDSGFGDPLVQTDDEGPYLEIRSSVTGTVARLPIVPAYRHLGGIITASGTPAPEINYRHSLAAGVIRPLRTRLFASPTIPLRTRLHLLKSLAISRFAFGSAAILMCAALHGRLWYKYYISIWRSIWKRGKGEPTMHSYEVLRRAGAPSPPLALALSRAVFIRQLVRSGPSTLLHLLRVQWCCAPESSWLGQLERDVEHVALFLPELRDLLPARRRLESLLEAITDAPNWWVSKVKQAGAVFQKDLERWRKAKDDAGEAPSVRPSAALLASSSEEPELFSCSWCPAKFTLRKHLGAHLAKSHGIFSPARHLAFGTSCISCLKCYHSVARVQAHLKSSDRCLRRSCLLAPPLSVPDIRNVEDEETKGFGPANLTADERLAACGEDLELSVLSRLYRPSPTFLAWIDAFIDGRSHEGPRCGAASFWHSRPTFHPNSTC